MDAVLEEMRIVILSDIHANVTAFKDVLADILNIGKVDAYAIIGDLVNYGPRPNGIVEMVKGLDKLAKIMHKLYYQEDNHWVEETTTRILPESEVPPDIVAQIKRQKSQDKTKDADITSEMEEELQLEV